MIDTNLNEPGVGLDSVLDNGLSNTSTALWKYISEYTRDISKYIGSIPKYLSLSDTPPLSNILIESADNICNSNSHKTNIGECLFKNGSKYTGEFNEGVMHGTGVYEWQDRVRYKGSIANNRIEGKGKYSWNDGSEYCGEVNGGLKNGYGELRITGCKLYVGEWLSGKMNGKGMMIFEFDDNGNPISYYEGEWKEDSREGYGERVYRSGNIYKGQWLRNLPNGQGTMIWRDRQEIYTGDWYDGKQHGIGEVIWDIDSVNNAQFPKRNRYTGDWRRGVRHGKGTFYYATGTVFSGLWVNGKKEGIGIYTHLDGNIRRGVFSDDKLVRSVLSTNDRPLTPISRLVGDVDSMEKNSRTEIFNQSLFYLVTDRVDRNIELQSVQFTLLRSIDELKWIYHYYSSLGITGNEDTSSFTRCKFWQLLSDCQLFYKDTYVEIDRLFIQCLPDKHASELLYNPFTEFLLREFLQCLVVIGLHLYQSLYKGEPGRLSWCLRYLIEESLIPRSCHGKGYYYQQNHIFSLSKHYFTPCHKLYTAVSRSVAKTISYRQFILMLKDCGVIDLLSVEIVIGLITNINPLVYQESSYRMTLEMNFLEFLNILLNCAILVPVPDDSQLFHSLNNMDENVNLASSSIVQGSSLQQSGESLDNAKVNLQHSALKLESSQQRSNDHIEQSNYDMLNNTGIDESNSQLLVIQSDRKTPSLVLDSSFTIVKSENAIIKLDSNTNFISQTNLPVLESKWTAMTPDKWKSHLKYFFDDLLFPNANLAMQPPVYLKFSYN